MDNAKTITCECGQPNSLVLIEGVWCYDKARHGKTEDLPAGGKCFNCHRPMTTASKIDEIATEAASKALETEIPEPKEPNLDIDLTAMTIPKLRELAADRDIEIPKDVRRKAEIIDILRGATRDL